MIAIITYLGIGILIYFIIMAGWYGLTLITSFPDIFQSYIEVKYGNLNRLIEKNSYLPITIIIPAYNEEKRITNVMMSILNNTYKNVNIIIVNDGSTDNTLEFLIEKLNLYEIPPIIKQTIPTCAVRHLYKSKKYDNITVIDKEHSPAGNGADANNCGVNATTTPVFLTIDSDTILEPDALSHLLLRFITKDHTITIGGVIYVLNGNKVENGKLVTPVIPDQLIPAFQSMEYLRSFTYGRSGLNMFAGALCNPGAFTMNETNVVKEVNGYDSLNYAYDVELTMKLHNLSRLKKYPTKIYFVSNAISWTEVPARLRTYWNQRNRWQRGMLKSAFKFSNFFLNPKFGLTGLVVFPAFVIFDIFSPVIEFISYVFLILILIFDIFSLYTIFLFIFFAWGYITIVTIISFYLNLTTFNKFKNLTLLKVISLVTLEMFGFRQYRAACCFFGTLQYFFNRLIGKPL